MSTKILLADDSITIQKVIGIIFGSEEYSLTVVDNGKAAVDKARETAPDILLIDAMMPGMSGYEACEQIRTLPGLADKPILLLTGSFEPFDEGKARSCGADDFIAKPFEAQHIVTKVKELIARGPSRTATPTEPPAVKPAPQPQAPDIFAGFTAPPAASFADSPAASFADSHAAPANPFFSAAPAAAAFAAPQPPASAAAANATPPATPAFSAAPPADDIWGAFTSAAEPAPVAAEPKNAPLPDQGPDIFAIASSGTPQPPATPPSLGQNSQAASDSWGGLDEQAFEFGAAPVATKTTPAAAAPLLAVDENAFAEVSFADTFQPEPPPQTAPLPQTSFDVLEAMEPLATLPEQQPPVAMPAAAVEMLEPEPAFMQTAAAAASVEPAATPFAGLSEEQLKAAISAASKDVIERIVWEVVPDLAEAMIREAIRKIKEGV